MRSWIIRLSLLFELLQVLRAQPVPVQIEHQDGGFRLLRAGRAYFINGVGLPMDFRPEQLAEIKRHGANSVRIWDDCPQAAELLREADRLGLTVTFGLWLEHERHGFSYNRVEDIARQRDRVRKIVLKYRDSPALLLWGIGNEVEEFPSPEHGAPGADAAIWAEIEVLASLVKKWDSRHPAMTAMAELGGRKLRTLATLCPDIEVAGINTYSGVLTVADRSQEQAPELPYILSEYGPRGHWEAPTTSWGAVLEPTSTAKAQAYRDGWIAQTSPSAAARCLGGYAFIWGNKQEATLTWFGLCLPDGDHLAGVDVLEELWTGRAPAHRVPSISRIRWRGRDVVAPGESLSAEWDVENSRDEALKLEWEVREDNREIPAGGDREVPLARRTVAVLSASRRQVEFRAPAGPGRYRFYLVVRDDFHGAATANLPFLVRAPDGH